MCSTLLILLEMLLTLHRFLPIRTQLRKFLLYILALSVLPQLAGAVGALIDRVGEGDFVIPQSDSVAAAPTALEPAKAQTAPVADVPLIDAALDIADTLVMPMLDDSSQMPEYITVSTPDSDSIVMEVDTFVPYITPVTSKVDLDQAVDFSSNDSMVIVRRDSAFMYGNSSVEYGDMKLEAANIEMNLRNNNVYAIGVTDSTGEIQGKPIFSQGGSDYEAATMRYNFKTQKGFITNVVTQQGEGYLTGGVAKRTRTATTLSKTVSTPPAMTTTIRTSIFSLPRQRYAPVRILSRVPHIWCWRACRCRWQCLSDTSPSAKAMPRVS